MKAKNERAVSTLRMVNSALKNADIEARGAGKPPRAAAAVRSLLQKMIKQRQESVELYQKGGRADLVKQEQEEIAIISGYLPKEMSDDEMKAAIEAAVKETGAAGMKDMGKVIGVLRGKYAGQVDMANASGMVKARLSGGRTSYNRSRCSYVRQPTGAPPPDDAFWSASANELLS